MLRTAALREIGGVATDTIVEDMHTTLGLLRAGWRTAYHHQTLAVGLAPATADEYLLQRRRWGLGLMQVLVKERLWSSKRYLSWRNYYECVTGAVWWLEGVGTLLLLMVPITLLVSGAQTSTANPWIFSAVFAGTFAIRLLGHEAPLPPPAQLAQRAGTPRAAHPGRVVVPVVAAHPADPGVPGHPEGRVRRARPRTGSPDHLVPGHRPGHASSPTPRPASPA